MRVPARRRTGLEFNITPMIDVVFNLIIFFLVATHFVRSEAREPVQLPSATETDERPLPPRQLVVTVLADGALRVAGKPVQLSDVEEMIREDVAAGTEDYGILIRSDLRATYREVEPLLLACARHGVTQVRFAKVDR
jgi:biopolymer transport protein ExbD